MDVGIRYDDFLKGAASRVGEISQEESSVHRIHALVASLLLVSDSIYNIVVDVKEEKDADDDKEA